MRQTEPEESPAWLVGEGDVLIGGPVVLTVMREPVSGTVRISTTSQPVGVVLQRDDIVRVLSRAR